MKKFTCNECGHEVMEEVLEDVTLTSEITKVIYDEDDDSFSFEYGKATTDNETITEVRIQCEGCGEEVTKNDLMCLVEDSDKEI